MRAVRAAVTRHAAAPKARRPHAFESRGRRTVDRLLRKQPLEQLAAVIEDRLGERGDQSRDSGEDDDDAEDDVDEREELGARARRRQIAVANRRHRDVRKVDRIQRRPLALGGRLDRLVKEDSDGEVPDVQA